ncbi:hypothetical protein [Rubrivivax gelatinosus]|uniref:hypothetical protein n=1 Tax=Rubrivivax gelatinosus TaxID=28068 RepID=UPI001F5B2045|nr:hypothetical protein [Rubrivivax gelatinosus]
MLQRLHPGRVPMIRLLLRLRRAARQARALPSKELLLAEISRQGASDGRIVRADPLPAIVVAVLATIVAAWRHQAAEDGQALAALLVALLAGALPVAAFAARRRFIDTVLTQSAMLDRGLAAVDCDGPRLWRDWRAVFPDFERGDEGQTVDRLVEGEWTDESGLAHKIACYRFSWVEVRQSSSTDADGKQREDTQRTTQHRHGVVVSLAPPLTLAVSEVRKPKMPVPWSTASIEFGERWRVGAASEMQAARLLTPSVVQTFVETGRHFRALDLHFAGDQGCISFSDDDLLGRADARRRTDRLDELRWRVRSTATMPKLDALTTLLRALCDAAAGLQARPEPAPPIPNRKAFP